MKSSVRMHSFIILTSSLVCLVIVGYDSVSSRNGCLIEGACAITSTFFIVISYGYKEVCSNSLLFYNNKVFPFAMFGHSKLTQTAKGRHLKTIAMNRHPVTLKIDLLLLTDSTQDLPPLDS